MTRIFTMAIAAIIFVSCGETEEGVNLQASIKKNDTAVARQQIVFGNAIKVDSLPVVIYPLVLEHQYTDGGGYSSSYGREVLSFWNLIFYNTETGTSRLLTDTGRILISSIDLEMGSSSGGIPVPQGISVFRDHIVYKAVTNDDNRNKILDEKDASGLFVSGRDGSGFRRISPEGVDIISWEAIRGSSRIIMTGRRDQNGDHRFDEKDRNIPMIVDLQSEQTAAPVFPPAFTDSLGRKLVSIWSR